MVQINKKNVVLVLLGLLVGCGAGAVAKDRLSAQVPGPPMSGNANAQPMAGMRWQQFCEQAGSVEDASQRAGARGMEGFEMVALYNGVICFKRPWGGMGAMPGAMSPMPGGAPPNPSNWPGY